MTLYSDTVKLTYR